MVGSKYHDFIQSADAIAKMQGKSEYLEGNINGFVTLAEDVATHTKELLSRTSIDSSKPLTNNVKATCAGHGRMTGMLPLDGSSVWNCLEDCDIYSAAAVVVQSQVVLDVSLMSMHRNNNKDLTISHVSPSRGNNISSFLAHALIDDLAVLVKNSSLPGSSPSAANSPPALALTTGCASAAFLAQTVLDDARLLLLEGSCSSLEKVMTPLPWSCLYVYPLTFHCIHGSYSSPTLNVTSHFPLTNPHTNASSQQPLICPPLLLLLTGAIVGRLWSSHRHQHQHHQHCYCSNRAKQRQFWFFDTS